MTISANFPVTRPALLLDFSNQTVLDPRVTFARTTTAYYYDNKSAALAEQNLVLQSNTFTTGWTVTNLGTPVVGATDPAGGATAYTLTATLGGTYHYLSGTSFAVGVGTYVLSAYLQAGTNNFATITASTSSTVWVSATFNLTAGSVALSKSQTGSGLITYSSYALTQVGSTNWWRCSLIFTSSSTLNVSPNIQLNSSATPTYGVNGLESWTAAGTETLLVYGVQVEQRSLPTVYTATTATAVNTYTPTLQTAAINAPRFDYDPVTRQSLGLLLEQASTNLFTYSSDYTNAAWVKTACTITAAADISPDGTQNASLLVLSTVNTTHNFGENLTFAAGSLTSSFYLKYYGQQFIQLYTSAATGLTYCNFDLQNGSAGTPAGPGSPTASIISVGNGWYRCSLTLTAVSGVSFFSIAGVTLLTSGTLQSFAGNGFNGYLIWGAQIEQAPSATSYIATTSAATTRNADAASMTGTNFTSWYNYSGGTVYVEAASGNPTTATLPTSLAITDGTSNNYLAVFYTSLAVRTTVIINNVSIQSATVNLPSASVANTFYKTSWYFSGAGNGVSSVGQAATTYATAVVAPAFNQLLIASTSTAVVNPINGRIKKFAYYPLALTNTQIQSLSAN